MSRPLQRLGDINAAGGKIILGHFNVTCNGRPTAKYMSLVTPHPSCPKVKKHCAAKAAFPGSFKVKINGSPAIRDGDTDTCGHPRVMGSNNVRCG
jgi:uncharacterized Zn-binding protein involved in type VI secretion